jgi:hypothetical protein
MAPTAAVMSSAEVISKTQTYLPKMRSANPLTLPGSTLTLSRPAGSASVKDPTARNMTAARARATTSDAARCPRIVSVRESEASTPISMRTNRKIIITAPV